MRQNLSFQYPANLGKARKHGSANRIYKTYIADKKDDERCQCCGRRVGIQSYSENKCMYNPVQDLSFLGPGVPILFIFIQNGSFLLLTLFVVFSLYALISNIVGNSCKDLSGCIVNTWNQMSVSNNIYHQNSLLVQAILILCFVILYNIINQFFVYRVREVDYICDKDLRSPSDYSIIITNLPENVTKKDILFMIQDQRIGIEPEDKEKNMNLQVNDIILSYDLQTYENEWEEQAKLFNESRLKYEDQDFVFKQPTIPTQTGYFAIVIFTKQFSKTMFIEEISFLQKIKNIFVYYCESHIGRFKVGQNGVAITKGPEPDDILWSNAKKSKDTVIRNRFLTHVGGIVILLIGFAIQYYMQSAKNQSLNTQFQQVIIILDTVLLTITSALIVKFLVFVTKLKGNYTKTQQNQSLLIKICLYEFFNGGLFNSAAAILAQQLSSFNIHGKFSQEIIIFMIRNALVPNILNLIFTKLQPEENLKRYLLEKVCLKYNQKQANQLFQNPRIHFPEKYSYVIKMIWLCCFYAPLAPVIIPITIFGLAFYYVTEAILFRKNYSVPKMLSFGIAETAIRLLNFTALVISVGQMLIIFYIKYRLKGQINVVQVIPIIITMILCIAVIFVPYFTINAHFYPVYNIERKLFTPQPDKDVHNRTFQTGLKRSPYFNLVKTQFLMSQVGNRLCLC